MFSFSLKRGRSGSILRGLVALVLLAGMIGLPQRPAEAAGHIFYASPTGTHSFADTCPDWTNACELSYAVQQAGSGEYVYALKGTYTFGVLASADSTYALNSGAMVYGGFDGTVGQLPGDRDLVNDASTLDGSLTHGNVYHVVTITSGSSATTLDGFTITAGGDPAGSGADSQGGGVYVIGGGPHLSNLILHDNNAHFGGALYIENSLAVVSSVAFNHNSANKGGGANIGSNSSVVLTNVTFYNNYTTGNGAAGGLRVYNSNVSVNDAFFNHNTAYSGAGILYENSHGHITNTTLYNNTAATYGGGIQNTGGSYPDINNVTFLDNTAGTNGEAMQSFDSNPTVENSIVWGTAVPGHDPIVTLTSGVTTVSYSDVLGGFTGVGNFSKNPLLGSPGTYGGSVQSFPLLPGSPAINAGDTSTCTTPDVRNVNRPQMSICDMGAYEAHSFTLTYSAGDNQSEPILTPFSGLDVGVSSLYGDPVNGGTVRYTQPVTGPSATFAGGPLGTIGGGQASMAATANGYCGSYVITADTAGSPDTITFHLTNTCPYNLFLPLIHR